jgi:DNA primase
MKLEIDKAVKRRFSKEKKKQEQISLSPVRNHQPKDRTIRYDNMKSAMAEELLLALVMKEPGLLDQTGELTGESFSSPLLGRVFDQLLSRHRQALEVSLGVLSGFAPEEMSHIAGVLQSQEAPVSENALADCIRTIRSENRKRKVTSDDDLLALRDQLRERKGIKL